MRIIKLSEQKLTETLMRYLNSGVSIKTFFEDKKTVQAFEVVGANIRYQIEDAKPQQKEYAINKKDEKYTVLKNHYDTLLKRFHEISGKLREIDSASRTETEKFMREADALLAECTERMNKITCYLMDISEIAELRESVIDEWRKDHDKVIVTKRDNDGRYWISADREEYMKHGTE